MRFNKMCKIIERNDFLNLSCILILMKQCGNFRAMCQSSNEGV